MENLFTSVAKRAIKLADDDAQLIALDIVRAMGENRAWHVSEAVALMDLATQMARLERSL